MRERQKRKKRKESKERLKRMIEFKECDIQETMTGDERNESMKERDQHEKYESGKIGEMQGRERE